MASNFKILAQEKNSDLHMKLIGDFDGSSAHQLIDTVRKRGNRSPSIFVTTDNISHIYPFNCDAFYAKLAELHGTLACNLRLTGERTAAFGPANSLCSR